MVLAVIALVVWLCGWWAHGRFLQSTNDATINADQQAVTNRVAGYVDRIYAADNQVVRQGDLLVRLDQGDPQAKRWSRRAVRWRRAAPPSPRRTPRSASRWPP